MHSEMRTFALSCGSITRGNKMSDVWGKILKSINEIKEKLKTVTDEETLLAVRNELAELVKFIELELYKDLIDGTVS